MTSTAMQSQDRVVVGVDGSPASVEALRWAGRYAAAVGRTIDAITVWSYPPQYGFAGAALEWRPDEDARKTLDVALTTAFGQAIPAGLRTRVCEGHASKVLVDSSRGADLLVVGSRGHGGFTGLLLGSVSAYCAEHAACPVVVDRHVATSHAASATPPLVATAR